MAPPLTRLRRLAGIAACVALLVGVTAGCGTRAADDSAGTGLPAAEKGAYPVTITHKFGTTRVTAVPRRVVTVGLTDQDAALALGTVPVATTKWLTTAYPGAIGPWATSRLGPHRAPTVLSDTGTGPQVEKIAALKPDLILALYAGLTKDQYRTLTKIAPVVAQPSGLADYGISWQKQTEMIGAALGRPAKARKLVADTEAGIRKAADQHPEFRGKEAVMATPWQGMFVYGSQDNRSRLLTSLGFRLPKDLDTVIGDEFGANISKERTDLLDTDATIWLVANMTSDPAKLHANPLYGKLPVVEQGREVFVRDGTDYGNAVSFQSVLSLPYTVDRFVPQLVAAVDGDPATTVPRTEK